MIITIQGDAERRFRIYYQYDNDSIPLGQGGMGIVYEGTCHRVDNPSEYLDVAIKKVTTSDPDLIERARREASIQLVHPNLIKMFGFIPNREKDPYTRNERTNYYVAMERLTGINLDAVLNGMVTDKKGQVMDQARRLYALFQTDRCRFVKTVMLPILSGVQALHDAGYIHRDIDPSNVMVTEDGEIKLIDFGIAKKSSALGTNARLTQTGSIIGKPEYAAPELISGDVQAHNATTDIYSLGIMMFQFYAGYLPFSGDRNQIMKAQMNDSVPLKAIDHKGIRAIIKKATQKNQSRRYQRVADMIADLELIPDTERVQESDEEESVPLGMSPFDTNPSVQAEPVYPEPEAPRVSEVFPEPEIIQQPVYPSEPIPGPAPSIGHTTEVYQPSLITIVKPSEPPKWLTPVLVTVGVISGVILAIFFPISLFS